MKYIALLLITAFFIMLPSAYSYAQTAPSCGNRDEMVSIAKIKYRENLANLGIMKSNKQNSILIEVLVNDVDDTWTMLKTIVTKENPKGFSCVLATGIDWINLKKSAGEMVLK